VEDEKTLLLGRGGEGIFCFLQLIDGENPFPPLTNFNNNIGCAVSIYKKGLECS